MAANSIMNSAFQKIGVFGKIQRGSRMLRILLADDDPVFLSKLERLLTQYAEQKQLNVQIGAYTRDDMSSFILQPYSRSGESVSAAAADDARFSESSVYHLGSSFTEIL